MLYITFEVTYQKKYMTFEVTSILLLSRFKILGPDGSDYLSGQEAILGGSDTDDA